MMLIFAVVASVMSVLVLFVNLSNSGYVTYFNNRLQERKDLADQLTKLRLTLVQVATSKFTIDQELANSDSLEESKEYPNMKIFISSILKNCITVINKYKKIIGNEATTDTLTTRNQQPSSTTEPEIPLGADVIVNMQDLKSVMDEELKKGIRHMLENWKPTDNLGKVIFALLELELELEHSMTGVLKNIMTWKRHPLKNLELAECSRDIDKHIQQAKDVHKRLNVDNMTTKSNKFKLKKLTEDTNFLPVFNDYATDVLNFLRAEGKSIVGIHGLPGVGKTTVLKRLHNRVIDDGLQFQHVIWIDFPLEEEEERLERAVGVDKLEKENEIYLKMQVEIMRQLSIPHKATTKTDENKAEISLFLNAKKYLLIMDQVSRKVDLAKLVVGLRDDHSGMNVVIASSAKKFFPENTDEDIPIQGLNEDHAWTLFQKAYGKEIDEGVIAIARRIVECCGRIPLYINQMAAYLKKDKNESVWMDAKRILQSQPKNCEYLGLAGFDKMYEKIYQDMRIGSAKKCLLYGALFPIQHRIYKDYLVECWIAEGFIVTPDKRLRSCRDRGETIVSHLTGTYLMEWCSGNKYVKMQPNFRRVALELDYPKGKNFIIWIPSEVQRSNKNDQTAGTRMSMIDSKTELPSIPKDYDIYTLLLQKANLNHFSDQDFNGMPNLQVLDLYKTNIEALPESIGVLTNLKGLYLNGCKSLDHLPPEAAKLVRLEFLDIRSTKMSSLPEEIGSMVNLRCLRASLYTKISNPNLEGNEVVDPKALVPAKILNGLKKLEELILDSDKIDDQCWAGMAERLALELASLENLKKYNFDFPNVKERHKLDIQSNLRREDVASTSGSV